MNSKLTKFMVVLAALASTTLAAVEKNKTINEKPKNVSKIERQTPPKTSKVAMGIFVLGVLSMGIGVCSVIDSASKKNQVKALELSAVLAGFLLSVGAMALDGKSKAKIIALEKQTQNADNRIITKKSTILQSVQNTKE